MLTIEDLMAATGYSKSTVHVLCTRLEIKAKRGQVKGNPGKGTYTAQDCKKLTDYKYYISKQLSVAEAVREVLNGA
jgi:DNA-binding IclR family transcriptional regulator